MTSHYCVGTAAVSVPGLLGSHCYLLTGPDVIISHFGRRSFSLLMPAEVTLVPERSSFCSVLRLSRWTNPLSEMAVSDRFNSSSSVRPRRCFNPSSTTYL